MLGRPSLSEASRHLRSADGDLLAAQTSPARPIQADRPYVVSYFTPSGATTPDGALLRQARGGLPFTAVTEAGSGQRLVAGARSHSSPSPGAAGTGRLGVRPRSRRVATGVEAGGRRPAATPGLSSRREFRPHGPYAASGRTPAGTRL